MLALDGVISLVVIVLWLYCLFDVLSTDEAAIRTLPKVAWFFVVLLFGETALGPILWLAYGRPKGAAALRGRSPAAGPQPVRTARGRRSRAPDDDPDFLRQLNKQSDDHEQLLNNWEADLRRREERLRRDDDTR